MAHVAMSSPLAPVVAAVEGLRLQHMADTGPELEITMRRLTRAMKDARNPAEPR